MRRPCRSPGWYNQRIGGFHSRSNVLNTKPTADEASDIKERDIAVLVLLMIVTCGLYWFYLCFAWTKEINGLAGRVKYQPWVVLLVNIVTCGLAGLVFECLFAFDIAQEAGSRGVPQRMENLGVWVIVCNCAATLLSLTAYGVVIAIPLGILASALVQVELNKLAATKLESSP